MKKCRLCEVTKPAQDFYVSKVNQDGLHSWCKACTKEEARLRYLADPAAAVAAVRRRDQASGGSVARSKQWREANPERARQHRTKGNQVRRARLRNGDVREILPSDLRRLTARYGGLCAYDCGRRAIEWDHVVPLARGGRHAIGNLLPCCGRCNRSKNRRLLAEWRRLLVLASRKAA